MRFWDLLKLRLVGDSLNYLTPAELVGEIWRVNSLRHEMPITQGAASVTVAKFNKFFCGHPVYQPGLDPGCTPAAAQAGTGSMALGRSSHVHDPPGIALFKLAVPLVRSSGDLPEKMAASPGILPYAYESDRGIRSRKLKIL
jgi:hypothetical protein